MARALIVIPLHAQLGSRVVVAVHYYCELHIEKYTSDRSSRQPHGTTLSGLTAGNGMLVTATTINAHLFR